MEKLFHYSLIAFFAIAAQAADRPNVLLLIADDLSPDLGSYGAPVVQTPHLDALADRGVRFTDALATSSVCSPSRSAIFTGTYQTRIDSHQHRNFDPKPLPQGIRVLTELFREAGYFAFNADAEDLSVEGKMDLNFVAPEVLFDGTFWDQRDEDQPFFGMVQFNEAHRDFSGDADHPIAADSVTLPPFYPDHPLMRRDWANYLEDIQNLDRKVGHILGRLAEEGLMENTLVIFLADHGRPMPRAKQFLYEGGLQIPLIAAWPDHLGEGVVDDRLVSTIDILPSCLSAVGLEVPERIDGRPLLFSDTPGRTHLYAARDRCGEAADRIRMVRTGDYKLIRNFYPTRPYTVFSAYKEIQYPSLHLLRFLYQRNELNEVQARFMGPTRPYEELYYLPDDPHEINNLAGSEAHADVRAELAATLDTWIIESGDAGAIPEPYEIEVDWYLRNQAWYHQTLEERGMLGEDTPERHVEYWTERLMP